jgi:hypothetical protein
LLYADLRETCFGRVEVYAFPHYGPVFTNPASVTDWKESSFSGYGWGHGDSDLGPRLQLAVLEH